MNASRRFVTQLRQDARTELAEARKCLASGMPVVIANLLALRSILRAGELRAQARIRQERAAAEGVDRACFDCDGLGGGHGPFGAWICSPCGGVRRAA